MKRTLYSIAIGLGILVVGLIVAGIGYDLLVFKPYLPHIQAIIRESNPLYKDASEDLYPIVTLAEGNERIVSDVAQSLLIQFGRNQRRMLTWHIDSLLWTFLLNLHVNDAENLTLWCHFAPYEDGIGLNESANFYYERDINQLNTEELITIIARVRNPSYYQENPEKLKERVDKLLAQYLSQ